VLERKSVIETLNIALLSRQHIFLVSKPGTAKSLLGELKAKLLTDCKVSTVACHSYIKPSEILGPMSIKELQNDRQIFCTENYIPTAHIAVIDEVFKADKQLSALLGVINEREFRQNGVPVSCPLITAMLFSNELPQDRENNAFWNRVFFRFQIGYVSESDSMDKIIEGKFGKLSDHPGYKNALVSLEELEACQAEVCKVKIGDDCKDAIRTVFRLLRTEGIDCSDRQLRWAGMVVKAHAFLSGKTVADVKDVIVLENALWNDPESHIQVVKKTVADCSNPQLAKINEILATSAKVYRRSISDMESRRKQVKELAELFNDLERMKDTVSPRNVVEFNRAHSVCRLNSTDAVKMMAENVA
jgi:MoxR-like ATPase